MNRRPTTGLGSVLPIAIVVALMGLGVARMNCAQLEIEDNKGETPSALATDSAP